MLIKYGKLNPIDEETTIIDDITLFFEKDDPFSFNIKSSHKKELSSHILGVQVKITYLNKEKLIIEGLDKIYKVKSLRHGKFKFFNPKETPTIEINYEENHTYFIDCLKLIENIVYSHEYITHSLKLDPENFYDGNKISFKFGINEMKSKLLELNSSDNLDIINGLQDLIQYSYYFILKAYTFSNIIYQSSNMTNEIFKLLYIEDLKTKLDKIFEIFENLQKFIIMKYEFYKFPQTSQLYFQLENPFAHQTEEEIKSC
jgi:hypothetical protein